MALIPLSNVLNESNTAFKQEVVNTQDYAGRRVSYTMFGDTPVANRADSVSIQFQYNISSYDTNTIISGTGTAAPADNKAVVSSGTGIGSSRIESVSPIIHYPGHESHAVFDAVFSAPDALGFQKIGPFNGEGFWIGYQGTQFGVAARNGDVDTFIPQGSWNGEQLLSGDFILNPQAMNLYRVTYGWGVVPTVFEVSADSGKSWVVIHTIDSRNSLVTPFLDNPSLPMAVEASTSSAVTSAVTVGTSTWSAGSAVCEGTVEAASRYVSMYSGTKSVTAATRTNIITIDSPTTWQGKANRIPSQLVYISVSAEGTKPVDFSFVRNATVGGTPTFVPISADSSPLEMDTAGTIVSGGTLSWGTTVAKSSQVALNTSDYMLILPPGHKTTLQAYSTANTEVSVFLRAKDMF